MSMLVSQGIELASSVLTDTQHECAEALVHTNVGAFQHFVEGLGTYLCAFVLDHAGRIRYLSPSAGGILDVAPRDVVGMPWEHIVAWRSEAVLAGIEAERRIMQSKTALRLVYGFFTHDGEQRAVRVWAAPLLDDTGMVTGIAGYLERADYRLIDHTPDNLEL